MKRIVAMVLGAMAALCVGAAAQAQVCTTTCSMYEEGQCVEYEHSCETPEPPKPSYGAIAYGKKSQAYGFSYQWDSEAKAESEALKNCAKNGPDCEIMVWFERRCGAVAARSDGKYAYWGLGDGEGAAREEAMRQCTKDGGQGCEVKVSQCSR